MDDKIAREPCTLDNCGHMRQLDAIVTLLGMARGTRSVLDEVNARMEEIRRTWRKATEAKGQTEAFRILERMVDRLGYGRIENNPSLAVAESVAVTPSKTETAP